MAALNKKRKLDAGRVEEITFDPSARQEYLTGFHKRKVQRKENAREQAVKRDKEEKVLARKQIRDQRKEDLDRSIKEFNIELRKQNPDLSDPESDNDAEDGEGGEEWAGIDGDGTGAQANGEAKGFEPEQDEYVDEDKYTTVTVEPMSYGSEDDEDEADNGKEEVNGADHAAKTNTSLGHDKTAGKGRPWLKSKDGYGGPKKKKKKFRYESKAERAVTRNKQKSKNKAAKAKREKK